MALNQHTLKVRMSRELAEQWFTRDANGNRLTVEWGEPDDDGFYTPIIHVDYTDNIAATKPVPLEVEA